MKRAGMRWRVSSCDDGQFDELVIDNWLHLEAMDVRAYFLSIGKRSIWISINKKGEAVITHEETKP